MTASELRARYDKAVQERAVAEARREAAEQQLRDIIAKLKDKYGVSSIAEAQDKVVELQAKIDSLTQQIEKELDAVQH